MTRLLDVHLNLMARLPVRTIPAKPRPENERFSVYGGKEGRRTEEEVLRMNRRIRVMASAGADVVEIAEELKVSPPTVYKHLNGQISTVAKAIKRRQ